MSTPSKASNEKGTEREGDADRIVRGIQRKRRVEVYRSGKCKGMNEEKGWKRRSRGIAKEDKGMSRT